jgi:hypothetical protein
VRGDSLRDLYAKALALLGLAALAAIGAIFDYWPVSNDLPHLVDRGLPVVTPRPLPVPAMTAVATSPARVARPAAPIDARRDDISVPVAAVPSPVTFALAAPAPFDTFNLGTSVALMPAPAKSNDTGHALAMPQPADTDFAWFETVPQQVELFPAPVSSDNGSAVSFVTDALKKTGDTIVRTGMKTGASIRDALVTFGGAFRKIL